VSAAAAPSTAPSGPSDRPTVRPSDLTVRPSDLTVRPSEWAPPVVLTVAAKGDGVADLLAALDRHHAWLEESGALDQRRRRRLLDRTREVVDRAARRWVWEETRASERIEQRLDDIASRAASPYEVAAEVLESLKQGGRP
jgi:LAO/AO transport system kinase